MRTYERINAQIDILHDEVAQWNLCDSECAATCWFYIGKCYDVLKKYDKAENSYQRGIRLLAKQQSHSHLVSRTVLRLGNLFFRTNRSLQAIHLYTDASLSVLMPASVHTSYVHIRLGDLYIESQEYGHAEANYEAALCQLQAVNAPPEIVFDALLRQALCFLLTNRYEQSYDALCSAECAFPTGEKAARRKGLRKLSCRMLLRYSAELLERYAISGGGTQQPSSAACIRRMVSACIHIGTILKLRNSSKSKEYYFRAFNLLIAHECEPKMVAKLALKVAKLFRASHEYRGIRTVLGAAIDICRDADAQNCASLFEALGRYLLKECPYQTDLAEQNYRSAYNVRKMNDSYKRTNATFEALVSIYQFTEKFEKLEMLFYEHLQVTPEQNKYSIWLNLATHYESQGLLEKAEKCYSTLLDGYDRSKQYDCTYISVLTRLGTCYNLQMRTNKAETCYRQAAALFQPSHPSVQSVIATYTSSSMSDSVNSIYSFFKLRHELGFLESFLQNVVAATSHNFESCDVPLTLLGKVYRKMRRREAASACFLEVLHRSSKSTIAAIMLLRISAKEGLNNSEIEELRAMPWDKRSQCSGLDTRFADFHEKNGRFATAEMCYLKILSNKAMEEDRWNLIGCNIIEQLGWFYHRVGRKSEADTCFEKCSEVLLSFRQGIQSETLEKYWESTGQREKITQFLERSRDKNRWNFYRKDTESILDRCLEMRKIEEQSFQLTDIAEISIANEPIMTFKVLQTDEVSPPSIICRYIEYHEKVNLSDPRVASAYYSLATLYSKSLRRQAEQTYQSAIHIFSLIDPNSVFTRLSKHSLAMHYSKIGRKTEAEAMLKALIGEWPARSESLSFALGDIYLMLQRYSDAEPCFKLAYEERKRRNPKSTAAVSSLEKLSFVYDLTNRRKDAIKCELKIVDLVCSREGGRKNYYEAVSAAIRLSRKNEKEIAERALVLMAKSGKVHLRTIYQTK